VINPNPAEQMPPRPNFPLNDRAARLARARRFQLGFLTVLLVAGVVVLATRHYTVGGFLAGWAVFRLTIVTVRRSRRRRRERELGLS
jgi:Flp pilus assembly protein TadB